MQDDIYIIGGGPSLKGFDFEQLRDLDTIAVNVAALDAPPIPVEDQRVLIRNKELQAILDRISTLEENR